MEQNIREKIKQRRAQMLVHCYLYYVRDTSVISDHQWQKYADELTSLQKEYGTEIGFYDEMFRDWDGSTGCHLKYDGEVLQWAEKLLNNVITKREPS